MRIDLNLPALERLIGGDTEIEIGLRQQVVEEFARKHLKTVINDETWKRFSAQWNKEINTEIGNAIQGLAGNGHFKSEAADIGLKIRNQIEHVASEMINKALNAIIDRQRIFLASQLDEKIKSILNFDIQKRVEAEVQRRLTVAKNLPAQT